MLTFLLTNRRPACCNSSSSCSSKLSGHVELACSPAAPFTGFGLVANPSFPLKLPRTSVPKLPKAFFEVDAACPKAFSAAA